MGTKVSVSQVKIAAVLLFGFSSIAADPIFTPKQLSDLKATGRAVVLPKYLPEGFQVKKVIVNRQNPEVPSYVILFTGPDNTCFVVEMGTESGDCIIDDAKGKLYKPSGDITLFGEKTDLFKTPDYYGSCVTSPSGESAGYRIMGDSNVYPFDRDKEIGKICKKRLSMGELKKVAQSLEVLKR